MAHDREQAYFFGVWDKRMAEFEETAEEAFEKLAEKHRLELKTFQVRVLAHRSHSSDCHPQPTGLSRIYLPVLCIEPRVPR